jgi:Rha family phage regulatory protein
MKTKQLAKIDDIIEIDHGKPMVSSLTIANEFGRTHKNVLQSIDNLIKEGTLTGLGFKPSEYIDESGKANRMYLLDERSSLIAMPFIGGKKAKEGQSRLVDAYLFYRDNFKDPPRKGIVQAKRDAHLIAMDSLIEFRASIGKETGTVQFMSENKMMNWVVTGKFEKAEEGSLSNEEITVLEKVRLQNACMIDAGLSYDERKAGLVKFASSYRARRSTIKLVE